MEGSLDDGVINRVVAAEKRFYYKSGPLFTFLFGVVKYGLLYELDEPLIRQYARTALVLHYLTCGSGMVLDTS